MKYKMVCIDMDGTLLNKQHKVSEISKETLKKVHDMGVHIVISTGRMYTDAAAYSKLIGLKSPVIASNGALIRDKDEGEVIYKSVLGEPLSIKLLDLLKRYNVSPIFYTDEKAFTGSVLFKLRIEYIKLKGIINRCVKIKYIPSWRQWNNVLRREKEEIIKCEIIDIDLEILRKIRADLESIDGLEIASSSKRNVEITCRGVSKGRAIEVLSGYYGIKQEEIIAIGDSENDLSMIEYAGLGIAMGNAIDTVKNKADYVTDTNEYDGVAKALSKFILDYDK